MERRAAVKSDWETKEMPKRHAEFTMERKFTPEEVESLRFGNVPQAMEDKWFVYMEGDTLFAHRSWTGYCIYIVEFDFEKGVHKVTANRNAGQYSCTDTEEDKAELNALLDWWVQPWYDYYGEWVDETTRALERKK